jgi:nicotinamide-nucleotide amidase
VDAAIVTIGDPLGIFRVFGIGEAQVAEACAGLLEGDLATHGAGASIQYEVAFPEVLVRLVVRDQAGRAADRLATLAAALRTRLGPHLDGEGDETLIQRVGRRLAGRGLQVATAESCTGGLVGALLTSVPGASRYVRGGAITYADAEKVRQLGVSPATLAAHGAVSEEVVREMAAGALARFGVDVAVAVSGVAGPDGGTAAKPVGTVWLACAGGEAVSGAKGGTVAVKRLSWPGTRDQIRLGSAWWAIKMMEQTAFQVGAP